MDEPKSEPKNEPCLIYAQKVQDCLAKNKFDVPKCYSLMNKLEACCWIHNCLKISNFHDSSTVVEYTFRPAFNGENPSGIWSRAILGNNNRMRRPPIELPMSKGDFDAQLANYKKHEMERRAQRHVERHIEGVVTKNQDVYCSKVKVNHEGKTVLYTENKMVIKNLREEEKKQIHVGHNEADEPIISPTEDLEVMKNLSLLDLGAFDPTFENQGLFLSKLSVGHDGITKLFVEDKSTIKKMRDEEYMNKGVFCSMAQLSHGGVSFFVYRKRTGVDML